MGAEIEIMGVETLSEGWGTLKRYTFAIGHSDGSRATHRREVYDRGDAAVLLLHDRVRDTVVLTRQFRMPAHLSGGSGFLIEACAGVLDGDSPETCARREAEEETGYRPRALHPLFAAFMSPGSVTEKLHFFIGEYDESCRVGRGGGLDHEGEDIEVLELPLGRALGMVAGGEIVDAKTIMLLQHLALQQRGLRTG